MEWEQSQKSTNLESLVEHQNKTYFCYRTYVMRPEDFQIRTFLTLPYISAKVILVRLKTRGAVKLEKSVAA